MYSYLGDQPLHVPDCSQAVLNDIPDYSRMFRSPSSGSILRSVASDYNHYMTPALGCLSTFELTMANGDPAPGYISIDEETGGITFRSYSGSSVGDDLRTVISTGIRDTRPETLTSDSVLDDFESESARGKYPAVPDEDEGIIPEDK